MMLLRTIKLHRSQDEQRGEKPTKGRLKLTLEYCTLFKYPHSFFYFIKMHKKCPKRLLWFFRKGVIFCAEKKRGVDHVARYWKGRTVLSDSNMLV